MLKTLVAFVAVAFSLLSAGCVFVVPADELESNGDIGAASVTPDPAAPRLAPLDTRRFDDVPASAELIGEVQVLFTRWENTFSAIARQYDVGYEAMRRANPGVDHWLPGEGTPVYLPTRSILPDAPRDGILINLPSMRLFYFSDHAEDEAGETRFSVTTHPIGIGRQGWATPTGSAKVTDKAVDPVWYVPASVRKEHAERGDPLPAVVPPGPDNPLGRHAMLLSMPGYLIHGTNKPAGVGMRVSHGCIRLYPEDIEALFPRVPRGTPVHIVDQPVLAGWHDGELYLEVHRPLEEDERDLAEEAARVIAAAIERSGRTDVELDPNAIAKVLEEQRGIPFPISVAAASHAEYLAASRIVENTVPLPRSETAAALD